MKRFSIALLLAFVPGIALAGDMVTPAQGFAVTSPALDALLGATPGGVAVRGANGWVNTGSGVSGQALTSQGAGVAPIWSSITSPTSSGWDVVLGNKATTSGHNPQVTTGDLLQFGGSSASFTALKPSGTTLKLRLADDSGDGLFTAGYGIFNGAGTNQSVYLSQPTATSGLPSSVGGSIVLSRPSDGSGISWAAMCGQGAGVDVQSICQYAQGGVLGGSAVAGARMRLGGDAGVMISNAQTLAGFFGTAHPNASWYFSGDNVSFSGASGTVVGWSAGADAVAALNVGLSSGGAAIVKVGNGTANDSSGTLVATTLTGTLSTAAQPNVTSLGTLTSLTVSGNVTASGLGLGGASAVSNTLVVGPAAAVGVGQIDNVNDGGQAKIGNTDYGSSTPFMTQRRALGTLASPTTVGVNNNLGSYRLDGYDGTAFSSRAAAIEAQATETWSNTAHGSVLNFNVTQKGTTALYTPLQIGSGTASAAGATVVQLDSTAGFGWTSGTVSASSVLDTAILRDAANVLAQRNGTTAQAARFYNTFTDASNYERFNVDWQASANVLTIETTKSGTGVARSITLQTPTTAGMTIGVGHGNGAGSLNFQSQDVTRWTIDSSGNLLAQSTGAVSLTSGTQLKWNSDVGWSRQGAAGIIGLLNNGSLGSATQLRVYATTDAASGAPTNADWLEITTVAGGAKTISTNKAGTGTAGSLILATGGTTALTIDSAQAATFAQALSVSGNILGSAGVQAGSSSQIGWASRAKLSSSADGLIQLTNSSITSFTSLELGALTPTGTDTAAQTPIILVGAGTGAGANGTLRLQAAPAISGGGSSSAVNAQTTLLTLAAVQNNLASAAFSNGALCEVANVTFGDGAQAGTGSFCGLRIAPTLNYTNGTKAQNFTALLIQQTNTSAPTGTLNLIDAQTGGTSQFSVQSNGKVTIAGSVGSLGLQQSAPATGGTIAMSGKVSIYSGVTTAGWGVPAIYGSGRATAQTAANTSVATYTCGAADGSFEVSANLNVTTSTTFSINVQVTYTDETNTAQTVTVPMIQTTGTFLTAITNVQGIGPYEGPSLHIRCKASTAITIKTAGTFTSVTYNVEGSIRQIS